MANTPLVGRQEHAATSALVVAPFAEGLRVYAVADPKRSYLVTGTAQAPECTCEDFQRSGDATWRCPHILAATNQLPVASGNGHGEPEAHDLEERRGIQEDDRSLRPRETAPASGPAQMLLKRSVSPDGRIDSLSVELACPVDEASAEEIRTTARGILELQSDIVEEFLERSAAPNGKPNGASAASGNGSPAVPARVVAVGGMPGKWGRRLFLIFDMEGRTLRLFGNQKQLGEHLAAAGFPQLSGEVAEGLGLNLPCRIITRPSGNGRFLDVERVLPVETQSQSRQSR